jgi:UDP-glucuronate 4-epimerase
LKKQQKNKRLKHLHINIYRKRKMNHKDQIEKESISRKNSDDHTVSIEDIRHSERKLTQKNRSIQRESTSLCHSSTSMHNIDIYLTSNRGNTRGSNLSDEDEDESNPESGISTPTDDASNFSMEGDETDDLDDNESEKDVDTSNHTDSASSSSSSDHMMINDTDEAVTSLPELNLDHLLPVQVRDEFKVVLVTGGAGFIGSHVADALLARGDYVVIVDEVNDYYDVNIKQSNLDMLRTKYGENNLAIYDDVDICNVEKMEIIFTTHKPRFVCHLAARAGVRPSIQDPFIYIHSNIEGTTRLLELARKHGNDNFVWASSSSVYGDSAKEVFSESDCVDFPVSPYAASKKACELLTHTYHHLYKLNVTGLRFFTVYGPRGRPDMAPFIFVDRVSRGVEIQQFGDGSSSRDYTYIDDIVDGVVRAVDRPLGYQVFNLGNGAPTKLKDFISLVAKHTGETPKIKVLPNQPGDVQKTCADIRRAKLLLGYDPQTPFANGIEKTVKWYQRFYNKK